MTWCFSHSLFYMNLKSATFLFNLKIMKKICRRHSWTRWEEELRNWKFVSVLQPEKAKLRYSIAGFKKHGLEVLFLKGILQVRRHSSFLGLPLPTCTRESRKKMKIPCKYSSYLNLKEAIYSFHPVRGLLSCLQKNF